MEMKLVDFLANLGKDSTLVRASSEELRVAMALAGFSAAERNALANADRREIEKHVGATTNTCCIIFPTEESDEEEAVPAQQLRAAA